MDALFDTFYNQNNNQSVEVEDSSALDQCMDLAFAWCDTLGIPRETIRHQYAHQIWDEMTDVTRQYFDPIQNSPDAKPSKGDILVFKIVTGIPVGHVSIETGKSDLTNLTSFDQNWNTVNDHHLDSEGNIIPYCHEVVHSNYYGCIGWLHPKNTPQVTPVPTPSAPENNYSEKQAVIDAYQALVGMYPSDDELSYKLAELSKGENMVDILKEFKGDSRFQAINCPVQPTVSTTIPTPDPSTAPEGSQEVTPTLPPDGPILKNSWLTKLINYLKSLKK